MQLVASCLSQSANAEYCNPVFALFALLSPLSIAAEFVSMADVNAKTYTALPSAMLTTSAAMDAYMSGMCNCAMWSSSF